MVNFVVGLDAPSKGAEPRFRYLPMASLYIHIPFCKNKCFYCSFVVAIGKEHYIDDYLSALEKETGTYDRPEIESIYIGGGTPSFMDAAQLHRLSRIVRENFHFQADGEFTLEANPENIDSPKAKAIKEMGVNRVSMGAQSFDERYLKFLGRTHTAGHIALAVDCLRKENFTNISLDLMFSFPGQTLEELKKDLKSLTALQSEHVSLYSLTIEEGTKFEKQRVKLDQDTFQAEHYLCVMDFLEKEGFRQYEVSNFAKAGFESRHNRMYWQGENYIGLGVGAHSHKDGKRFWNTPNVNSYIASLQKGERPVEGFEELPLAKRLQEALVFGLRMNEGVNLLELEKRFGALFSQDTRDAMKEFRDAGFFIQDGNRLKTTLKGRLVLDELSARLV